MTISFPAVQGTKDLRSALAKSQSKVRRTQDGSIDHLKYDSYSGNWVHGANSTIATDELVLINTASFVHGWHQWVDKEVNKAMVSFTQDLPEPMEPKRNKRNQLCEANEARGFQGMLVSDGEPFPVSWEHSTDGCRRSIDRVLSALYQRMEESDYLYPKVKLTSGEAYKNPYKEGEMIHPPLLEIVAWCNDQGEEEGEQPDLLEASEEAEEEAEAQPNRRRRNRG